MRGRIDRWRRARPRAGRDVSGDRGEVADDGLVLDAIDRDEIDDEWPTALAPAVSARGAAPG